MADEYRVVGPPGAGKTQFIRYTVERWVNEGLYKPDNFLLTSFTRAAATELAGRVPVPEENTATLHAHVYRALGRPEIAEVKTLAKQWNEQSIPGSWKVGADLAGLEDRQLADDKAGWALAHYNLGRSLQWEPTDFRYGHIADFIKAWEAFKSDTDSVDFTDLLTRGLAELPEAPGEPPVIFVDEAQDLTPLQWALVRQWAEAPSAERFIVVGDPAQTLFTFAGANPDIFLRPLPPDRERRLGLSRTYRVPRAVHQRAEDWLAQEHSSGITDGRTWVARDAEGFVREIDATWKWPLLMVDAAQSLAADGWRVMILASCSYMLRPAIAQLREAGILFHNPYRRNNGAWNPFMRSRNGVVTTLERIQAFLRPEWTWPVFANWVQMLKVQGEDSPFRARGVRKALLERSVRAENRRNHAELGEGFTERARVLIEARDLRWLARSVTKPYQRSIAYAAAIAQQHGPEALDAEPKIVVGNVHSVKGGEADIVYLIPDLSYAAWTDGQESVAGHDANARMAYVGMTRAKEGLVIARPGTKFALDL